MALTFLGLVEKVLNESDKPMSSMQIWTDAVLKGYDKLLSDPNRGKRLTPWSTIGALLYLNMKKEEELSIFIKTSKGYYWLKEKIKFLNLKESQIEERADKSEKESDKSTGLDNIKEKDLHTPLAEYLFDTHKMYSKTINANAISKTKKGAMEWGTPDMVGVVFRQYNKTLQKLSSQLNITDVELWAFELKIKLNMSNLTEYFFQTVSNSSWANESWLVATDIQDDPDFKLELQRLNQVFKIGILRLDYDNPIESEIVFPAIKKNQLELDTMNKLAKNKEFEEFLQHVSTILDIPNDNHKGRETMAKGYFKIK